MPRSPKAPPAGRPARRNTTGEDRAVEGLLGAEQPLGLERGAADLPAGDRLPPGTDEGVLDRVAVGQGYRPAASGQAGERRPALAHPPEPVAGLADRLWTYRHDNDLQITADPTH